jgi:hypothetical protein
MMSCLEYFITLLIGFISLFQLNGTIGTEQLFTANSGRLILPPVWASFVSEIVTHRNKC